MVTHGYTDKCPKCGGNTLEVEKRYGDSREECNCCGFFSEHSLDLHRVGIIDKSQAQHQYQVVNTWFGVPSNLDSQDVHWIYNSELMRPRRVVLDGPMHNALRRGHMGILEIVRSLGTEAISLREKNHQMTLLHAAALGGNVEGVRGLLDLGFDGEATDRHGATALHWAAQKHTCPR